MREAYRRQKNDLMGTLEKQKRYMAVFFIYNGNTIPEYNDVFEKMKPALKRLKKIADEAGTENT